ncbi:MAG: GNAT family N-acetyltransferase [Chloroflexi bacterium]|nr:MAG: GNAT family N-acetyltransferase [Chloroflexota bacterium]MBL1194422.1 GNAT family N-acetyltransferase [Chloroflexota bacterium]NOH11710.1 GNAT family N-acetyltransferase [Chloroflexota bacterium]
MTAATALMQSQSSTNIRPFDLRRDLGAVADLVEQCFAETLDNDGKRFISNMRSAARRAQRLGWAALAAENFSIQLGGFVWERDGEIIGNLSLIPARALEKRTYLIANVAVHPDFRRSGIARKLTEAAVDHLRKRGVTTAWLQVRAENEAAQTLYQNQGFIERARRTTWHSENTTRSVANPEVAVRPQRHQDWPKQHLWLQRLYPPEVVWHLPLNFSMLRPGIRGTFRRALSERSFMQWSAFAQGQHIASLTWQSSYSQADFLWLAAAPDHEEAGAYNLLTHARKSLRAGRMLSLDYPEGRMSGTLEACGFEAHQTLIWMESKLL